MSERILEVDYKDGEFTLRVTPSRLKVIPGATANHLKAANRELLMALRGALDRLIESTEPKEKPAGKRRTRIEVKQEEAE